jgi:Lsr2
MVGAPRPRRYGKRMAKKVQTVVTLTDDLDGTKADRSVSFTVDGVAYEIDLSKKNATAFTKLLTPYVSAARKAPKLPRRGATSRASVPRNDVSEVRTWARANGYNVNDRGRVPAGVVEAYDTAH